MELELGLKIIKTRDDIDSLSEYQLAKDKAGPVFKSRETNTMFILTGYLKGYKKNTIDIKISEDGSKILISGKKPIQEMLIMGWVMHRKDVEIRGFKKVFKIPDGVILDRIKAKYDDEEWILNFFMPKLVKGISGARIEEIKEEESERGRLEQEKSETDHVLRSVGETSQKGSKESEVQEMEDSKSVMEKKEGEVSDKMLDNANTEKNKETIEKEVEESTLRIEDENGERKKVKVGKEGYEIMKTSEEEQNVGVHISQKDADTSHDQVSEVKRMKDSKNVEKEGGISDKMLNDSNRNMLGEMIQKEIEESELGVEDGDGEKMKEKVGKEGREAMKTSELEQNVGEHITQIIGDTSQGDSKEPMIQQMGEAKSTVEKMEREESGKILVKANEFGKTSELDQNVADHIPSNIDGISEEEFKQSKIQQMEKTESIEWKMGRGESERKPVEAKKDIHKTISGDTIQKDIKKPKTETEDENKKCVSEKDGKKGVDAMTIRQESPKQLPKAALEEREGLNVPKMQKTEDVKEEMVERKGEEVEYFVKNGEGKGTKRMHVEAKKDIIKKKIQEEIEKTKNEIKDSGEQHVLENTVREGMAETGSSMEKVEGEESKKRTKEASWVTEKSSVTETLQKETEVYNIERKARDEQEKLPKQMVEAIAQDEDKTEYGDVNLKEEGSTKMHIEPNEVFEEETTGDRIEKEISKQKLESSDSPRGKENADHGGSDGSKRQKSPEMGENEDVKKEGAKIAQVIKRVKGEKHEKMQVEANGGLKNDITRKTTGKETEEPKILIKEKDQQCLQEEVSKGRNEASTTAGESPMRIVDSLAKTREGPKDKEIESAEEIKEEAAKRKSKETKVIESTTKEKILEYEGERITQTLHQVPEEKHPKALVIGTPERELQPANGPTTCEVAASVGFKEVEQGSAKEKTQKTEMLPPKIQSKETHDSKNESVNQDILKPEKTKEVEREQCTHDTESTKQVATIEDQVAKPLSAPRFPAIQQSKAEEKDKLYDEGSKEKCKASLESRKEDPPKDKQNLIEMKENQEAKQMETLKPEIPLEKGGQVILKDEFQKGQKEGETMLEKTEWPKKKFDDRDQQFVQRDVGKGVGNVETIGMEMPKEECVADAGTLAERIETKRDLKASLEREEYKTTQNVNDEKPRIEEEIRKADIGKVDDKAKYFEESMKTTQEKELPISVTSMEVEEAVPKNEIKELNQKELSPLTAEMKSKEPLELEKQIMEWKFPKTKEYVPVPKSEDIKAPKIAAYQGAKPSTLQRPTLIQQSIDEENRKSENVVEAHEATRESPKKDIEENEEMGSLQPQVHEENQCFEEEQKFDWQEEALDQYGFQGPKILTEDRGQQYAQESNDKKGYQTRDAVEEESLKREHREEMVLEKREGPKVAKSGEGNEASRQLLKREKGETKTADEKHKMKEITPELEKANGFKQVVEKMHATRDREHQREPEEVTSKMGVEPPTTIEITPNKGIEKKEPRELSWPSMDYESPKIEEVEQEKEKERHIHALEATVSKEEGLAQATATHSKPKGDIDEPQVNQLPSPLSKEPRELDKFSTKEDDSKVESLVQVGERKESIHSIEDTAASEVVADKVAEPSNVSRSTQQFQGKDKTDTGPEVGNQKSQETKKKDSKIDVQESTKSKQPQSPADQQCINKDQEESHGIHKIEEKAYTEEQKECKEEESGGKKDDTKGSKKLFVPLVIAAGSALLVSLVVIFVRHRRARKSTK